MKVNWKKYGPLLFFLVIFFGVFQVHAQVSDGCAGAIPIGCNATVTGTTVGSTSDVIPAGCVSNTTPGVWYQFIGTGVTTSISLCGSGFDTRIAVMSGTCGALICEAGNDDFCGLQSQVNITATLGVTYYILVYGYSGSGNFTLNVTCITPQVNDTCAGAIPIVCGQTITGNTLGASPDAIPAACYFDNTAPGLWYTFTGNGQYMNASLCGSLFDTQIAVLTGSCGSFTCAATNDQFCGNQSQVTIPTTVGTTYYIYVFGFLGAAGNFTLNVSCGLPPANDLCGGAIPLSCGNTTTGSTNFAGSDIIPSACFNSNSSPGVWYSFTGNGNMMTLSLCGSAFDTQISIFTGTCASLTCVGYNDDYLICGSQSQISVATLLGTTYYAYVHGDYASGNFTLQLTCPPPPPPPCVASGPTGCPNITLGPDIVLPSCVVPCSNVPITATFFNPGTTTSYSACSIPYTPYPYNTGTGFSIGIDDKWTPLINLPFNFCFFGNNYSQCVVGSNGVLSFNNAYASGVCPWAFTASCPDAALPRNAIFGVYHDIDPSIYCGAALCGDARYASFGVAPCRVFVVSWDNLPHFSGVCNYLRTSCEIVLYETSNIIEVYIENKPICYSWNSGNALVGIQNSTGTVGYTPSGRNTGLWVAVNEGWRFTPTGPSNTVVSWAQQSANLGTGATMNVCPSQTTQTYVATATYTRCDGTTIAVSDDIIVQCSQLLLPVEWKSFATSPTSDGKKVNCYWTTATERNNDYFTIERSPDAETWQEIGRVNGAGNSLHEHSYSFMDVTPLNNTSYYRIRQTDYDGTNSYSEIRSVTRELSSEIFVYPNPAKEKIQIAPWKPTYRLKLYFSGGSEVPIEWSELGQVNTSQLISGSYILEVMDESGVVVEHVAVMVSH